jgi:hypothetical protein
LNERARSRLLHLFGDGEEPRFTGTFARPVNLKEIATVLGNDRFTMMAETPMPRGAIRAAPGPGF